MPQLITVSGRHIVLLPKHEYVLGRDPACDIVVDDCSCSRRHVKLGVDASGRNVYVEDLQSRNGTYLNGRKLRGAIRVPDGGQIHVGSTLFVVAHDRVSSETPETREMKSGETLFLEARLSASEAEETRIDDSDPTTIQGRLSSVHLPDVIQLLTQMRRSGTLKLELPGKEGRIELRAGKVLAAYHERERGLAALKALARCVEGRFHFVESDSPCESNVELSTPRLLLEICRYLDESTAVEKTVEGPCSS